MKKIILMLSTLVCGLVLVGCGGHKGTYGGDNVQKHVLPSDTHIMNNNAIDAFYNKALTVNTETNPVEALGPFLADGFKSTGSVGSKTGEELLGQLGFFWKLIPDLKWEIQETINEGDKYVVRSKATGTPNGDFFGLPTDGSKFFEIMTIDIHTIKDGKIQSTHHVEDWATAMQQLKPTGKNPTADQGKETMDIAMKFMGAMGEGDMETIMNLMDEDMVWQNNGDKTMPWIGPWNGKTAILEEFMPAFGEGFKTTLWETEDAISQGDTAAFFGQMKGIANKSGQETTEFTFGLRVKVKDGKIVLWNWLEDSYAVSNAFNAK